MSNKLKPYTIIPPNLYVQRDADRQITSIINDMGRPGYVLVSRQMGKTNLLLNAKRRLESVDNIFVYVDLSNPFDNPRTCFENIIDIAIETHEDCFKQVAEKIYSKRKELIDGPAHKQHTSELRMLLNEVSGKIVIILDEIDALTKTPYSDQIFAQIRSIYFSRVNYPELEKLTYILSGVVEPTEIIKDPKISPFNIGQKIFLNDFSKEEFNKFIENAQINLSQDVLDRIFYWTSGNPRITWDLCSQIEKELESSELSSSTVDKIVKDLYLKSFDKPPIDNIREIVKNDKELRDAIIEIGYNKGKEVSDKVKNKLYLAGIINYGDDDIHIKNQIIKQSLNSDWIRSIAAEDKSLVKVALELFEKEKYQDSLIAFEKFLQDDDFEQAEKAICYYYMGYAAYRKSDFIKALEYLEKTDFDVSDDAKWYYRCLNLKGLTSYYNGGIEKSLDYFKDIISSGRKDDIYARALLNFGSISLKSDRIERQKDATEIFNSIIQEDATVNNKLSEELINELKSISYYNLAQISSSDNYEYAKSNFIEGIKLAKPSVKPSMILSLFSILKSDDEKRPLIDDLTELISTGKIVPTEQDPEKPIGLSFDLLKDIITLVFLDFFDTHFEKLKDSFNLLGNKTISNHLYDLAIYKIKTDKNWDIAKRIFEKLHANFENSIFEFDENTKYKVLKLLAYSNDIRTFENYYIEYSNMFQIKTYEPIDNVDIEIFSKLIHRLTERGEHLNALQKVQIINKKKDGLHDNNSVNFLLINHLELNLYNLLNHRFPAILKAREIISMFENGNISKQNVSILGSDALETIKQNAENTISPSNSKTLPKKSEQTMKDNDFVKVKFSDGKIFTVKFRKVKQDLELGKCIIVKE
ncbi:MAG: AAA-like domain-containing protein [Bacteroidia bacterium]|nr:AAA-like domain-containing protein [Bacteroidia bacterium]